MNVQVPGATQLSVDPEVLGRVQDLFENAVRRMRGHLLNRIGAEVPVRFGDVGYVAHGELMDQFLDEGAGVYLKFRVNPGHHVGVLAVDGALLFRIMGLLLGEDPWAEPAGGYIWRQPTRMDLTVARRIADDVFAGLIAALPPELGASIDVLDVTGNPRLDLPMARSTLLVDATLDFGPPEDPFGLMTLALPVTFTSTLWPDAVVPRRESPQGVSRVLPLPVTVVAELTRVKVPYGKLQRLAVGEVLDLGVLRSVAIAVAGRTTLTGEAGVADGARCVRVLQRTAPRA